MAPDPSTALFGPNSLALSPANKPNGLQGAADSAELEICSADTSWIVEVLHFLSWFVSFQITWSPVLVYVNGTARLISQ